MYTIVFAKSAAKEVYALPPKVVLKVVEAIETLAVDPRPNGVKRLVGSKNLWRIRVGDYRVVYSIDDVIMVVDVRKVGHRKEVYE